ncbi:16S rRNA (cytosine(967)-C(5))-methyltransferase RsmB [Thioalkalivibrio sp. HK1]|uniref:16S rRNA (cytosine(967)-C(5))-methyltransferase RsmB n=1 Tax=Thioalkalivibrio sp. HK1 TaxID=1469245 RepID=UPI0004721FDD|nr:16S rRNA (cytosine(967)-C(5))-methyltransferase RsmB [Thioalkalivibrio sp. HK1]
MSRRTASPPSSHRASKAKGRGGFKRRQTPKHRSSRALAHALLMDVLEKGRSLSASRDRHLDKNIEPRERALAQELAFGTLRHLSRLDAWLSQLVPQRPRKRDGDLRTLVLIGLYQLAFTRIPAHAAVASTVDLAQEIGKPWAAGFINAALRRFVREGESIRRRDLAPHIRLDHPPWLLERLREDWPLEWESIAHANLARAPMTLRINRRFDGRDRIIDDLEKAGIPARVTRRSAVGIVLESPHPVEDLPGFAQGRLSVQDEAAQLALGLLDIDHICAKSGERMQILDACAAPGGKAAHLLESDAQGTIDLLALDIGDMRIRELDATLTRLGLKARTRCADARRPDEWWDRKPFDRIIVDAPCSGSGVIRRHPDIKWLRRADDIEAMARLQNEILQALWPLLKPGGRLLYATCSVLSAENDAVIRRFIEHRDDAKVLPIEAPWGRATEKGRQILTGEDDMDGFFYSTLTKA